MNFKVVIHLFLILPLAILWSQRLDAGDSNKIQLQSSRMSQALGVCRDFFEAQQNSEWNRMLKLLDKSVTKGVKDGEGLSILASAAPSAVSVDGRVAPQVSFFGKSFDICFVSYWSFDETTAKSSYTLFVLRQGQDKKYRVVFSQPSRFSLLFADLFRSINP